jgi:hypothetical protein
VRWALLTRSEPANGLLDVDRRDVRRILRVAERRQAPARVGAPAEQVDEDGGVEEDGRQLPDPTPVSTPLIANPSAGILIPLVTAIRDRAERGVDRLPPLVVVQRAFDRPRNVGATAAGADAAVELANEIVAKSYVYSHGHNLTHSRESSHVPAREKTDIAGRFNLRPPGFGFGGHSLTSGQPEESCQTSGL